MSKSKIDLQKEIGYGFGTKIGYTKDGTVFISHDTVDVSGKPMQGITEVSPARAEEMANSLADAAQGARKYEKVVANG